MTRLRFLGAGRSVGALAVGLTGLLVAAACAGADVLDSSASGDEAAEVASASAQSQGGSDGEGSASAASGDGAVDGGGDGSEDAGPGAGSAPDDGASGTVPVGDGDTGSSSSGAGSASDSGTGDGTDGDAGSDPGGDGGTVIPTGVPPERLEQLNRCPQYGSGALCEVTTASDGYPIRFVVWPASDAPNLGALFVHFGGPGTDARSRVPDWRAGHADAALLRQFDVVAVEHRGTDPDDGLDCGGDATLHRLLTGAERNPDRASELAFEWMAGCPAGRFGSLAQAGDLAAVAADLGAGRNVFHGYSYGGLVGGLLAQHHDDTFDVVVLDSPALASSDPDYAIQQVEAFDRALAQFFARCDRVGCAFAARGDAETTYRRIAADYPLRGDLIYATVLLIYNENTWHILDPLLAGAAEGDNEGITWAADLYHERSGSSYPPSTEQFWVSDCADGVSRNDPDPDATRARLRASGPLGELSLSVEPDLDDLCSAWIGVPEPYELDATSSRAEVLVLTARDDPAVPFDTVQRTAANQLPGDATLVVTDGFNHSLWGAPDERCINDAVRAFLTGLPVEGAEPGIWLECR